MGFVKSIEVRQSIRVTLILAAACVVMVAAIAFITPTIDEPYSDKWLGRDYTKYLQMAVSGPHANVLLARIAPFCYRVLVPWTSHFIASDHVQFFWLVAFFSAALALVLLSLLFVHWGEKAVQVTIAAFLLLLTGPWREEFYSLYV